MENKIVKAFGTEAATSPLKEMTITRRDITAKDIEIEILYCGVCHFDLHTARNDWGGTVYPSVPGHEIVGKITRVGKDVTKFNVGDIAGVGCLVDSCRTCNSCKDQDSFILFVGLCHDIKKNRIFQMGYSYDFTINHLATNTMGSHEISLSMEFMNKKLFAKNARIKKRNKRAVECTDFGDRSFIF